MRETYSTFIISFKYISRKVCYLVQTRRQIARMSHIQSVQMNENKVLYLKFVTRNHYLTHGLMAQTYFPAGVVKNTKQNSFNAKYQVFFNKFY